jgi:hypothetical protein
VPRFSVSKSLSLYLGTNRLHSSSIDFFTAVVLRLSIILFTFLPPHSLPYQSAHPIPPERRTQSHPQPWLLSSTSNSFQTATARTIPRPATRSSSNIPAGCMMLPSPAITLRATSKSIFWSTRMPELGFRPMPYHVDWLSSQIRQLCWPWRFQNSNRCWSRHPRYGNQSALSSPDFSPFLVRLGPGRTADVFGRKEPIDYSRVSPSSLLPSLSLHHHFISPFYACLCGAAHSPLIS